MLFLDQAPRFLFFTGKGGVGKTSLACATAVRLAEAGRRVLLVSTDPASNVGQVFGVQIGNHITPIPAVAQLSALEIDPQAAAQLYRDRIVGPVRGVLPDTVVKSIEEQLSGACTTEIAAFDEFTSLLLDSPLTADFDHIVFDTAPTGHTIRLLQLPGAWSGFWKPAKAMPRAWARWPGWKSSAPRTRLPWMRCPTLCAPAWCWWPAPRVAPCVKQRAPTMNWRPSACRASTW
jgi:arsenite-transporting ATPase